MGGLATAISLILHSSHQPPVYTVLRARPISSYMASLQHTRPESALHHGLAPSPVSQPPGLCSRVSLKSPRRCQDATRPSCLTQWHQTLSCPSAGCTSFSELLVPSLAWTTLHFGHLHNWIEQMLVFQNANHVTRKTVHEMFGEDGELDFGCPTRQLLTYWGGSVQRIGLHRA